MATKKEEKEKRQKEKREKMKAAMDLIHDGFSLRQVQGETGIPLATLSANYKRITGNGLKETQEREAIPKFGRLTPALNFLQHYELEPRVEREGRLSYIKVCGQRVAVRNVIPQNRILFIQRLDRIRSADFVMVGSGKEWMCIPRERLPETATRLTFEKKDYAPFRDVAFVLFRALKNKIKRVFHSETPSV